MEKYKENINSDNAIVEVEPSVTESEEIIKDNWEEHYPIPESEEWEKEFDRLWDKWNYTRGDCYLETKDFIQSHSQKPIIEHCDNEDCPECQTKLLDKYKKELKEKIEKDLNDGKFYSICSNETTFKNYILDIINSN